MYLMKYDKAKLSGLVNCVGILPQKRNEKLDISECSQQPSLDKIFQLEFDFVVIDLTNRLRLS